ncbi:MAG: hypothetical protein H7333_02290 [Bdellovibrionales bacterium]|nr:hypothetical protein [Oligoflexia bacterium]
MKQTFRTAFALGITLLLCVPAHASKFANQFVEFELPNAWVCLLEGAEWVCQNQQDKDKKKDAIIILAAKIQGDQDTLDQYLAYLKNPKVYNTAQGKQVTSDVRYSNNKTIGDKSWVDALHLESEIPGFYTRYLATVTDGIGVLVTYSVNKNKYQEYAPTFESMVSSLKAFRHEGGLNAAPASSDLFKNTKVPAGVTGDTVFGNIQGADDGKKKRGPGGWAALLNDPMIFYGGIAAIALVVITIIKKRRGG